MTPESILQNVFGFLTFWTGQIDMIMNGKDSVVVVPTDGGKTVIYSIPTLMMPGIIVVVSPLLMLMHDQLLKLREKGINICYLNYLRKAMNLLSPTYLDLTVSMKYCSQVQKFYLVLQCKIYCKN